VQKKRYLVSKEQALLGDMKPRLLKASGSYRRGVRQENLLFSNLALYTARGENGDLSSTFRYEDIQLKTAVKTTEATLAPESGEGGPGKSLTPRGSQTTREGPEKLQEGLVRARSLREMRRTLRV